LPKETDAPLNGLPDAASVIFPRRVVWACALLNNKRDAVIAVKNRFMINYFGIGNK
jgi:hypothetical protein